MAEAMDDVERALRELGRELETPAPSVPLATLVMEHVAAEPVPMRSPLASAGLQMSAWLRMRLRWIVGLLLTLACSGVAVSPVGAEVVEWLGFHGVIISKDSQPPTGTPEVPRAEGGLRLNEATALVDFRPLVPQRLGAPDDVSVSADRRTLSMSWDAAGSGVARLDQFDAELSPVFWKLAFETAPTRVGDHEAMWFPIPHEVRLLTESGAEEVVPPRLAARTLIWAQGDRTLRLEGDLTLEQATRVAESVR